MTVHVSTSYPPEQVSPQAWAEFFAGLPHGAELAGVRVRIAPRGEVEGSCGAGALGCYHADELTFTADSGGFLTPEQVARHEYAHHIASHRPNPPWRATEWGTKRWASVQQICARARSGAVFPGDQGARYRLNPGEAFAEAYRVLADRKAGATLSSWGLVDDSFYPSEAALRGVEEDVTKPWTGPRRGNLRGRFRPGGSRRVVVSLATPLDGELTAELHLPTGRLDTLELLEPGGRVLARGLWSGTSVRRLTYVVCGERRLALRVTSVGARGRFDLTFLRP